MPVWLLTWLSRPSNRSIIKKRIAQNVGSGIMDTALGYAMKAKPGPRGIKREKREEGKGKRCSK